MEDKTLSMFEKMNEHEIDIKENRDRIGTLEEITLSLKESDRQHDERLKNLEDNAVKLENTVMSENRETRTTMREQGDKMFALVENAMGYQTARTAQSHELRMAKLNTWSTVFLKVSGGVVGLLSSGGAIYYALQQILK